MPSRVFNFWTRQTAPTVPIEMPPPSSAPIPTSSPLSSPTSFVTATATATPPNRRDGTVTDISSPAGGDVGASSGLLDQYQKARRLPPELKEHCRVYLEENLHQQTIHLLGSLLTSRRTDHRAPAYCPPPSQLSLLLGLVVHPDFTTRPKEPEWPEAAIESLAYLRTTLAVFGPVQAGFKESTRFSHASSSSSRGGTPDSDSEPDANDKDRDERGEVQLAGRYAEASVWKRGQDFFTVVGWVFNCSVLYPNRWRYWKPWLEFMLDVLDKDLEERYELDSQSGRDDMPELGQSILASYVSQCSGRTAGGIKRIMKAIFADGSKPATSLFQEVWVKEHKEKSHNAMNKRKREKVNIDKGEFGGWLDNDSVYSSQASEPPTPQKRRTNSGSVDKHEFQALESTYVESIPLRQRLFSTLSYLCYHLPDSPLDVSDLYESFEATTKSLPLPIFTAFVTSTTSQLLRSQQISALQGILSLLMPSSALSPAKVDRGRHDDGGISPAILEHCFLPYSANTITAEDNAKVSVLLEQLMHIVWLDGTEDFSQDLLSAVGRGIEARNAKIKKKKTRGRGNTDDPDMEARAVLDMSSERLVILAELLRDASTDLEDGMDADEDEREDEDEDEDEEGW
ncbi:Uu.00g061500.m01.CDS01 [Anthostomella pinea]|uniref:Uu.00g061500.m01.CDS01 n=1 Tax=Anthostomella pinea TaxID=933095 RepID=A0AAI8YMP0_9PEZI|nr:Uu.00g061500.m01.CDS01 [Anthostomella pinea]